MLVSVLFESLIAAGTSDNLFFIRTISAASIATSVPAPIAIPISALVSAGASLIPIHPAFLEADDEVLLPDSYEKATKKSSKKKIEQYEKILKLLNDGEWHKTAEIADNLGLKDTRTKELLKELIALDKLIDNGKTKGKLYRLK